MMRRAALLSGLMHLAIGLVAFFGLPTWFGDEPLVVRAITVEVVQIAEQTAAPDIAPTPAEAAPEPEPEPEAAPAPPKIAPPPPAPEPEPVRAEAPPPLPTPEPEPEEPEPLPEKEPEPEPERVEVPPTTPDLKPKLEIAEREEPEQVDHAKALRTVADAASAPSPEPDAPDTAATARPRQTATAFAEQLTASELDAVRSQIERCWLVPIGARDASDLVVQIKVYMRPDRTVQYAEVIDSQGLYNSDPFYRAAADSAYRAVLNPQCSPLQLPPDKYETWKEILLNFNPRDMF